MLRFTIEAATRALEEFHISECNKDGVARRGVITLGAGMRKLWISGFQASVKGTVEEYVRFPQRFPMHF